MSKKAKAFTLSLLGLIFFLVFLWSVMWLFSSASLASGPCQGKFSITHELFRCCQPFIAMIFIGASFLISTFFFSQSIKTYRSLKWAIHSSQRNSHISKIKIFAAIVLPFIVFLVGWIGYKNDTVIKQKASSMRMIQNLSATLKAVERCLADNRIDIAECDSAKTSLTKIADISRNYFITPQGLIGIDYKNQNFVLLASQKEEKSVTWKCFGHPKKSLPKSCSTVTSNAEE